MPGTEELGAVLQLLFTPYDPVQGTELPPHSKGGCMD